MKIPDKIRAMPPSPEKDYEIWWYNEGSGLFPFHNEDAEEHCRRVSKIAWLNGAFKAKEK
jgi:hypothetical protein